MGGHGHAAAITSSKNGGYRYDSYGANKGDHRHGQITFKTEQAALDFARKAGYTGFAKWETTPKQDAAAQGAADQYHTGLGKSYKTLIDYNLTDNNCQTMVNKMADATNIDMYIGPSNHPNMTYNRTKHGADSYGKIQ